MRAPEAKHGPTPTLARAPMRGPLLLAAGAHAIFLLVVLVGAALWPTRPPIPPVLAEVELVVQKTSSVGRPIKTAPAAPAEPKAGPAMRERSAVALPLPPPLPRHPNAPSRPERTAVAQPKPPAVPRSAPLAPPATPEAAGTGLVSGPQIIPAAIDAKVRNVPPAYPARARELGEQGSVLLEISVAPDGSARKVRVAKSSGYPILDRAARQAVAAWHFVAARRAGVPVLSTMRLRIRFELKAGERAALPFD